MTRFDEDAVAEPSESNWTESRFRQRLVGAAVVVALAVLLLPLWLDGSGIDSLRVQSIPEKPEIPDDSPGEISLPPAESAAPLESPPEELMPEAPTAETGGVEVPPVADTERSAGPEETGPATEASSPAATASADAPAEHDETPDADAEPAAAQPEASPAPTLPATSSDGEYVVQLGSFSDESNARGLSESVEGSGFEVMIEPLFSEQGTVWRVRVGPYATRDLAVEATERLRQRLGRDGLVMRK